MKKTVVIGGVALAVVFAGVAGYRQYIVSKLEEVVLAKLNDPDSAKIRNIRLFSDWTVDGSAMCGEVNAKNRMGGYVGYRRFNVLGSFYARIEDDLDLRLASQHKDLPDIYECKYGKSAPWWHLR